VNGRAPAEWQIDFAPVRRSLDYLQTRSDIDMHKLGYLGVSVGSAEGVIYTTIAQDRFETVIFLDGAIFWISRRWEAIRLISHSPEETSADGQRP